jgi:hypothetical protein
MLLVRSLGWLLLALAVAVGVNDILAWWAEAHLHLLSLGELWSKLEPGSLENTQRNVQRFANPGLWSWLARPVLAVPAIPVFLAIGLLLLWVGNRGDGRGEPGMIGTTRPPRRRHRGLR